MTSNKIREALKDLKEFQNVEGYADLKDMNKTYEALKLIKEYDEETVRKGFEAVTVATTLFAIKIYKAIEDAVEDIEDILDKADFDEAIIKSSDPFDRWILIEIKRTTAAIITEQIPLYLANVLSFDIESTYNGFQYVVTTKNNIKYLLTQESFNEVSQILFEMYNPKGEQ